MRITLHIGAFTVTIIVNAETATLAGDGFFKKLIHFLG